MSRLTAARLTAPSLVALLLCAAACQAEVTDETGTATGAATVGHEAAVEGCDQTEAAGTCKYKGKGCRLGTKVAGLVCQKSGLWTSGGATPDKDTADNDKACTYAGKKYRVGEVVAGLTCQANGTWM